MINTEFQQGIVKCAKEKGFSEDEAIKLAVLLPSRWSRVLSGAGKIMPQSIDPEINLRMHGIKPLSEMGQLKENPTAVLKGFDRPSFRSTPSFEEAAMPSPYTESPIPSTWGKTSPISMLGYQAELQAQGKKPLSMISQKPAISRLQQLYTQLQPDKGTITPPPTTTFPNTHIPIQNNVPVPPPPIRTPEFAPTQVMPRERLLAQAQMNKNSNFPSFPQALKPMLPKLPKMPLIPVTPVPKPNSFMTAQQGMKDVNNPRFGGPVIQPSLSDQIRFNRQYSNQ